MENELKQTTTTHFLLRLSKHEKQQLHLAAVKQGTTITSLVRYLLSNENTIEQFINQ